MNLQIRHITSSFDDLELLKKLNEEAFPKDERLEVDRLIQLADENLVEFVAVYDDEEFIGFYSLTVYHPSVYLFFIAILPEKRSKGYGTKTLQLLNQIYSKDQIVLDLEIIDETADNIKQRKSRKQFYLRNGYQESKYYMTYSNMTFELLCNSLPFQKQDFINLLETIKSPHFQPIVYLKERGNIL